MLAIKLEAIKSQAIKLINNANTAELLQLISSMRETAAQFPEDIRDGIILDIEAVEAEVINRRRNGIKAV